MIGNWNDFYVGKTQYRWRHSHDGRGSAILLTILNERNWINELREGSLQLKEGEWVFTRGAFATPWPTGTSVLRDAKQIVQVKLALDGGAKSDD